MFISKEGMLACVQPTPPLKGVAVHRLEGVHEIAHQWHMFDQLLDSISLQIVLHLLEKQKENWGYVDVTWGRIPHTRLHNVTFIVYILQAKIIYKLKFFNQGWFSISFVS